MRQSSFFSTLFFVLVLMSLEQLHAQTLQVSLSSAPKVNRTTSGGTATIFFDSNIEDLSIICTEENPNEPITKINDHLWFVNIDVNKDIEIDGICYRNFLLKCAASAEYYLTTDDIAPNQVLYYTITLPNELEPQLLESKARNISKVANSLINDGDIYLAMTLLLQFCDSISPMVAEVEAALRHAWNKYNHSGFKCVSVLPHKGMVFGGDYSQDGKIIATGCEDGYVRFWDAKNGSYLSSLPRQNGFIYNVTYSSNGDRILFSTEDKSIIYDLRNRTFKPLMGRDGSFEVDDNYVLTKSDDLFRLWSTSDGVLKKSFSRKGFSVGTLSPDGKSLYLATASTNFFLNIDTAFVVQLDFKTMKEKQRFKAHTGTIHNIKAIDNKKVLTASYDGYVKCWDIEKGEAKTFRVGTAVYDISHDSQFNRIGIGSNKHDAFIWDLLTGRRTTLEGHTECIQAVRFSPISNDVVTMSNDKTARIWHNADSISDILIKQKGFTCLDCSGDGNVLVLGNYNDNIYFVNTQTLKIDSVTSLYPDVRSVHLDNNQSKIIVTCGDMAPVSCTYIYDLKNNVVTDSTFNRMEEFQNLDFSSNFDKDGQYAYSIIGSSLTLWKVQDGKFSKCLYEDWDRVIPCAAFSETSKYFVFSFRNNNWHGIHLIDLTTMIGFEIETNASRDIRSIRFIGDNEILLVSTNEIELFDINTNKIQHSYSYRGVDFGDAYHLPNSNQILGFSSLASEKQSIIVWDKETCELNYMIPINTVISEVSLHDNNIYTVGFDDGFVHKIVVEDYNTIYNNVKRLVGNRSLSAEEKTQYNLE